MAKVKKSIVIDAPVEKVFNYIEEPTNIPEYWPSVLEIKDVEELPNGGARMTVVYQMAGVRFAIESECTEFVRNQRTVYESRGAASSTLTWTYEPHDGGTKVTAENEYTLNMPVLRKLGESFLTKVNENE
ncbi:MAG: SRPBCC family protein, partial [Anaerolineae bacterium]